MRERNRLLKEASRNSDWYRAVESQMAVAGAEIIENRNTALDKTKSFNEKLANLFPSCRSIINK